MQKTYPTVFLVTCLLAVFTVTGKSENFDDKRISTAAFPRDQALGITHILDPQLTAAIGSRFFKIWINNPQDFNASNFYLRVSSRDVYLQEDFDIAKFRNDTHETFIENLQPPDLAWLQEKANGNRDVVRIWDWRSNHDWDWLYEDLISLRSYDHNFLNRTREFLLDEFHNIDARFIEPQGSFGGRIKEFAIKTREFAQLGTADGFVFDNDPFGLQYRRNQNSRFLNRHLQDIQGTTCYQWVKVQGNIITYGDIHKIKIPRPINVTVCGDSYTSGEGAPLEAFNLPKWITELSGNNLPVSSRSHRSVMSGWEQALRLIIDQFFDYQAINIYNVSWSGAKVTNQDMSPIGVNGALDTAAKQMRTIDRILERDGHQITDIMGFTFGGNDALFSDLLKTIFFEDTEDDDWNINSNIWTYNIHSWRPPTRNRRLGNFGSAVQRASANLQWFADTIEGGDFGFSVNKVIYGNYPNPVGNRRARFGPIPGVPDWVAEIDPEELNIIRRNILPAINAMVAENAQRFEFANPDLADTFRYLPMLHPHHVKNYNDPWFRRVTTTSSSNETYNYAFHPNARGHGNIYMPLYHFRTTACMFSENYVQGTYAKESTKADLVVLGGGLRYEPGTSTLYIDLNVTNNGGAVSPRTTINLHNFFNAPPANTNPNGWTTLSAPISDITGEIIVIPEIEPTAEKNFSFPLIKGPEECVYYNLMLKHFLALRDRQDLQELFDNLPNEKTIATRMVAWNLLFSSDFVYYFKLTPAFGDEIGTGNSFDIGHLDSSIQNMLSWMLKTNPEYFNAIESRAINEFALNSLTEITEEEVVQKPELIGLFDIDTSSNFSRENVSKIMELSRLIEYGNQIANNKKYGLLNPNFTHFGQGATEDKITLNLPAGPTRLSIERFSEIPYLLPDDGALTSAVFHPGSSIANAQNTFLETPHKVTGLASFSSENRLIPNNLVSIELRFAPESESANWKLIDPLSGATFFSGIKTKSDGVNVINVSKHIFHRAMASVRVNDSNILDSYGNDYFLYNANPGATIQQEYVDQLGSDIQVKLTITGERARDLADGFEVLVYSDSGASLIYETSPFKLNSAIDETTPYIDFLLDIPLDFVDSSMRLVQLSSKSDPNTVLTTSLHLSALRPYLPSTLRAAHSGVEMEVLSDKEVVVRSSNAGLLMVDTTEDFKVWRRELTAMIDGNAPYNFAMPPSSSNKLYLRARMMKAQ